MQWLVYYKLRLPELVLDLVLYLHYWLLLTRRQQVVQTEGVSDDGLGPRDFTLDDIDGEVYFPGLKRVYFRVPTKATSLSL